MSLKAKLFYISDSVVVRISATVIRDDCTFVVNRSLQARPQPGAFLPPLQLTQTF